MKRLWVTFIGSVGICLSVWGLFIVACLTDSAFSAGWCSSRPTVVGAAIGRGGVLFLWAPIRSDDQPSGSRLVIDRAGVRFFVVRFATGRHSVYVGVPFWIIGLAVLLLAIAAYLPLRRRRYRLANARCLACGYDLRATPERCPECGAVAGQKF